MQNLMIKKGSKVCTHNLFFTKNGRKGSSNLSIWFDSSQIIYENLRIINIKLFIRTLMVVGNLSDMVPYWEVAPDPTFWVATFQVVTSWVVKRQQDIPDHNHHMIFDFAVLEISVAIVARLIEPLEEYEVLEIKDFNQTNC